MSVIETSTAPLAQQQANALLNVKDLRVTFATPDGDVTAVNDLTFLCELEKRWVLSENPVQVNRKRPLP
ncbi:Oligopeptide transport ATP-binding protein OppD (TC 3.A.1.5.1) [Citrobacter freundii]|uniref:Oligopeptide transport ATP-binding protein OppD (TC 3.A.1.5.1) n=1 Tax=Citrobacter freundii TaxID=546 RepID=A0A7G2IUR2_CITFR|nr:Oligopeptide transport ATP-binding protein OppD (TC 3.A.1.5.1) [Citrobacter freundii]